MSEPLFKKQKRAAVNDALRKEISYFKHKYPELHISRPTVSKKIKEHANIKFPLLDQALSYWVEEVTAATIEFNYQLIKEKGKEFAKLLLRFYRFHGEAGSVSTESLPEERRKLKTIISEFDPANICNADETGLFFQLEIQESETSIAMDIFNNLPSNAQQLVKNLEDYTVAVDELLATENILDDNEIVDMVLADAQIETNTINNSEEELEESPPAIITITEAYEALKKVIKFEEQLAEENFKHL
ncbi:hypothetical protein G9A89_020459 [Geosiphon pyriformis]|nr:hypothetical protein G9A89_020459 [Geosiphon pyriformis]